MSNLPHDTIPPVEIPAPAPQPSTAQVVSAALQNLAVIAGLTVGWLNGKLDTTIYVVAALLVVGIDFAGRKKLASSVIGATGLFTAFHGLAGVTVLVLAALGMGGCATSLPDAGRLLQAQRDHYVAACEPWPEAPEADKACRLAYEVIQTEVNSYRAANAQAE